MIIQEKRQKYNLDYTGVYKIHMYLNAISIWYEFLQRFLKDKGRLAMMF